MRRAIVAIAGTVAGLVLLLSFKTHPTTAVTSPPAAVSTPTATTKTAATTTQATTTGPKKKTIPAAAKTVTGQVAARSLVDHTVEQRPEAAVAGERVVGVGQLRVLVPQLGELLDHLRVLLAPRDDLLDRLRQVGDVDHRNAGIRRPQAGRQRDAGDQPLDEPHAAFLSC